MDTDFANMTDDELNALETASATEAETAPAPVETPAPETQQAAQPEDAELPLDPATSPEQEKTQRAVPVDEHMAMRRRAQEAEQRAQEYQRQVEAFEAQRQQNANQTEYDRLFEEVGPEAAEMFRENLLQRQAQAQQQEQQAQATTAHQRVALSEEFARMTWPDYDAQIQKVVDRFGAGEAYRLASQQSNPSEWAYQLGKSWETPAERQVSIDAIVTKAVAEALSKHQNPPSRGQTSVGHLSSTSSSGAPKAYGDMTDAELDDAERESRASFR